MSSILNLILGNRDCFLSLGLVRTASLTILFCLWQYILLHEDYQLYVLPRILESKRMAKSGRTKQKEADLEYSVAKQVEKMIRYYMQTFLFNSLDLPIWEEAKCDSLHIKIIKNAKIASPGSSLYPILLENLHITRINMCWQMATTCI